ncbi:MAG TPA: DsbA family protein [Candidatus Limnocylindrales bacterium]|nr:DsbA family protein [Candidatus Limnocylindrales bacterium]
MSATELTVYIDFLCPWAYRGSMWLDDVAAAGRIRPEYRFFSLMENHRTREAQGETPVWLQEGPVSGLAAFRAAIAARAQGVEAGDRFRRELQRARHEDGHKVDEAAAHQLAAERAGLDLARFHHDLRVVDFSDLAREHAEAVRKGVFGVPTLVWPEGRSYYVKISDLIPAARAVPLYDAIETVHRFGEVVEIKTPESEGTLAA